MTDLTRRRFLEMGALAGAGLTLPGSRLPDRPAATGTALPPWSMALHIHSSFSEGGGSMEAQLQQAAANGVDVLWWTDHDWRMSAYSYRQVVHFDSMTGEMEQGEAWNWRRTTDGALASSTVGIVTKPVSPLDPSAKGAARLAATSSGTARAEVRLTGVQERDRYRRSIAGLTLQIEVYPQAIGPNAYLEFNLEGSYRPARAGRRAGNTNLSYRIGGSGVAGSRVANGRFGVVTLAAEPGRWNSLTLRPIADARAIWPDIDGRDISLLNLSLAAVSTRSAPSAGVFDFLRFRREDTGGNTPLAEQRSMAAGYRASFPSVQSHVGSEVSYLNPHVNWYGGRVALTDYAKSAHDLGAPFDAATIGAVHRSGGIASYNHPYGPTGGAPLSVPAQEARRRTVTAKLLTGRALGADILEVGYRLRGHVTMARHVAAWDTCSRNGLYLTGSGTSDDHNGQGWAGLTNRFLTYAWAPSRSEDDLVAALAAGRIFIAEIGSFAGALDLSVDGGHPMGSVSTSSAASRRVLITAHGLPRGSRLQVVTGPVDHAGPAVPDPGTRIAASWPAAALRSGRVAYTCPTTTPAFLRTQVVDAGGTLIGVSNPVWLLRGDGGSTDVPAPRRSA